MKLCHVFFGVPRIFALRQEFLVVLVRVVDCIVKIFKVVETYEAHFKLLLGVQ